MDEQIIIYPTNIKKYIGNINIKDNLYIYKNKYKEYVEFNTYDDAVKYKKQRSNILGLTKNLIYDKIDYYEVKFIVRQNDIYMKFDKEDLHNIDKYVWNIKYINDKYRIYSGNLLFSHLIMKCNPCKIVHHINGDTLDNRKSNLMIISKSVNSILISNYNNANVGVNYNKYNNEWRSYYYSNNKRVYKYFSCSKYGYENAKKHAIEYREKKIKSCENYVISSILLDKRKQLDMNK